MESKTRSFEYTRQVLATLMQQARDEIKRLGGNKSVEAILERLVIPDPESEGQSTKSEK